MRGFRVAAVLLLIVLLGACSGGSGASDDAGGGSESAAGFGAAAPADGEMEATQAEVSQNRLTSQGSGLGVTAAEEGGGSADGDVAEDPGSKVPDIEPLPDAPAVGTGDRIIKKGTVSLEVEQGDFDNAFYAVIAAARDYEGDAVGSTTRTAENGDTFGSVTVRVPVRNFEDLLLGVGKIGTIRTRDVDSQDVSAEYTDLESRLRHLQAQERFYLGLFDQAESVDDAIRVQQQLEGIQGAIEEIQGRMNFLDDRTSFSTLTVELFEHGAGGTLLEEEETPGDRPTFARYWDTARDAFVNVVGAMLVFFVFLAPLLVPAVIVGALWISARRRRAVATVATPVRADEPETVGAER